MEDLRPGDTVFSYVQQSIPSVSVVISEAYESTRPPEFPEAMIWDARGLKADIAYEEVPSPIRIAYVVNKFKPLLPEKYSPLNKNGQGNACCEVL